MLATTRILTTAFTAALIVLAGASDALAEGQCYPACREGFVCHEGRCISACNPPCGPGEVCVEGRQCVAQQQAPAPPPQQQGGVPIVEHPQAAGSQVVVIEDTGQSPAQPAYPQARPYAQPQPATPAPAEPEYQDPMFAVHANMLGFLQFGPVLALELGGSFAGHLRLRFPNAGMINYVGLDVDIYDTEEIEFGIGVGGGVRYYLSSRGTMRGFYLGAALEVEYSEWYSERCGGTFSDCQEWDEETTRLVTMAQLGWRWGFSAFFFGVGGELGYASVLGHSRYDWETGVEDRSAEKDGSVFGMVALELGFYL